jgi:hypothetical protein
MCADELNIENTAHRRVSADAVCLTRYGAAIGAAVGAALVIVVVAMGVYVRARSVRTQDKFDRQYTPDSGGAHCARASSGQTSHFEYQTGTC